MALKDELKEDCATFRLGWKLRDGEDVPETEKVALGNEGVNLNATFLYADLVDSTELAMQSQQIAAEVVKAYLGGTTRIIRSLGGEIRSFDGDRVMGVFIGKYKNTPAAEAALKISHFFHKILIPACNSTYSFYNLDLKQAVGVDTSSVRVVRSGIRNNNDLVWIGRAPNVAAKLSALRDEGFTSFISEDVFNGMADGSKYKKGTTTLMWDKRYWAKGNAYGVGVVYCSDWSWTV